MKIMAVPVNLLVVEILGPPEHCQVRRPPSLKAWHTCDYHKEPIQIDWIWGEVLDKVTA